MFHLPPQDHKARELIDVGSLAEVLNPVNVAKLLPVYQARSQALKAFEADKAMKRIVMVVIRYDTAERWLVSFGRKGGWKKEWNFGNGQA